MRRWVQQQHHHQQVVRRVARQNKANGVYGVARQERHEPALTVPVVNPQSDVCVSRVLQHALRREGWIFDSEEVTAAPVALFYDLDAYDRLLGSCKKAFGPKFKHCAAAKANPVLPMLKRANERWGFGVECASIGELLLAYEYLECEDVVFDSPAKTKKELKFAVERDILCHLDNMAEYERCLELVQSAPGGVTRPRKLGFRINPSGVGAGSIAALSVSTPDSKFGVDVSDPASRQALIEAYRESPWLQSLHVHVGSGGMEPETQLAAGVQVAVELADEIDAVCGERRVKFLDMGGGLPVNYATDDFTSDTVPSFQDYADVLRRRVPALFSEHRFDAVFTEFGQSLNAKAGFLASRVEFVKKDPNRSAHLAIAHFGADLCVRQAYASSDHPRRFAAFDANGRPISISSSSRSAPRGGERGDKKSDDDEKNDDDGCNTKPWALGGPLCFQGDFVGRDLDLPDSLRPNDFVVMKDAGANTLSLFSRHCSRLAPPVLGFRWDPDASPDDPRVLDMTLLKPRETLDSLATFWGADALHSASSRRGLSDRDASPPVAAAV